MGSLRALVPASFLFACAVALGQGYPSKPVQFVVPYPPGGSNDVLARALAPRLSAKLGQPVLVDNRGGAGGVIGADALSKAPADGYTIGIISSSFTTSAAVQARLPFDPVKSFSAVALIGRGPLVLVVSPKVPARTPAEFIELAKASPDKLNYASSGPGSINQFATELFKLVTHIEISHVPYKGMGPATTDLIGGHVDAIIGGVPSVMQHVNAGKLRAIGVTTEKPSAAAPGLPPLAAGYDVELWWGVLAPAGVPAAIVERLNRDINTALAEPDMKAFLLKEGAEASAITPAAFGALIGTEIERWKHVAKLAGIKSE
jgi:tripartite-type tricarboxylate transporter receptor subunit TctC